MLDFTPVRNSEITLAELGAHLQPHDLRTLTNEMIDTMLAIMAGAQDADVVFVPDDPDAYDGAAATEAEIHIAWTLGHLVVHMTASSEESAALAAELARGVPHRPGRSRSEVHWTTVTTVAQCRARLEESRRMRLASLDMWPTVPDLENHYRSSENGPKINAITRFISGLRHDDNHLAQMRAVMAQAEAARS